MSTRKEAMGWWIKLSANRKTEICDSHPFMLHGVRRWETLTGREIEKLYQKLNPDLGIEISEDLANNELQFDKSSNKTFIDDDIPHNSTFDEDIH